MPVIQDELWKNPGNPGMIVVTSHASVENGRLFLGYGPAREAISRIPDIEQQCGREVLEHSVDGLYGFLPVRPSQPDKRRIGFGLFQTRRYPEEAANLELIDFSMTRLREFAEEYPEIKIRMNFPGISGGLPVDEVAPLLVPIPWSVTVCHTGEIVQKYPSEFPGFKEIYMEVENMLLDGQYDRAVQYLMSSGFDIQSAYNQVNAVQRILRERQDRETRHARQWREKGSQLFR